MLFIKYEVRLLQIQNILIKLKKKTCHIFVQTKLDSNRENISSQKIYPFLNYLFLTLPNSKVDIVQKIDEIFFLFYMEFSSTQNYEGTLYRKLGYFGRCLIFGLFGASLKTAKINTKNIT